MGGDRYADMVVAQRELPDQPDPGILVILVEIVDEEYNFSGF